MLLLPVLYGIVQRLDIHLFGQEYAAVLHLYGDVKVLVRCGTLYAGIVQNQMSLAGIGEGGEHVQCDFVHVRKVNVKVVMQS